MTRIAKSMTPPCEAQSSVGPVSGLLSPRPPLPLLGKRLPPARPHHLGAGPLTKTPPARTLPFAATTHPIPGLSSSTAKSSEHRPPSPGNPPACASTSATPLAGTDTPAGSSGAAPRPTFTPPSRSTLEDLLQWLLQVEHQLLDEEAVGVVRAALVGFKKWQRASRGGKPVRRPVPAAEAVVDCLQRACQAPSDTAAAAVLAEFCAGHLPAGLGEGEPCPPKLCPVVAAFAAFQLQKFLGEARPGEHAGMAVAGSLRLLDAAVELGHAGAMVSIGLCLKAGLGVPVDLDAALVWLGQAAQLGYVPAMHELGLLYEQGVSAGSECLEKDWGKAMWWYRRAAAAGHVPSQLNLGKFLLSVAQQQEVSQVVNRSEVDDMLSKARGWLGRAATSGCQEASRLLNRI